MISEASSTYIVEMKGLMYGSHDLSEHFKKNIRTSHLHLVQAGEEKFAQLYVLNSELATCRRMERWENSECNPELMRGH
ncbi:uncharacterized protein TNCV_4514971 [Trichonephila clavipes]|nr:uncharacterized protein TNCV_4514971 [Trichonephila clavipes]